MALADSPYFCPAVAPLVPARPFRSVPVDISVVMPIYNEELNIAALYDRLRGVLEKMTVSYELIFINDGSHFLVGLYTLYARFISHDYEPGRASLMVSILFLGRVQLISVGIIGEYIARLPANVRQRPLYLVSGTNMQPYESPGR